MIFAFSFLRKKKTCTGIYQKASHKYFIYNSAPGRRTIRYLYVSKMFTMIMCHLFLFLNKKHTHEQNKNKKYHWLWRKKKIYSIHFMAMFLFISILCSILQKTQHKKNEIFHQRFFSLNATKTAENYGFGHI